MTTSRIYRVADGENVRLVQATNQAQALRYCAARHFQIAPAKATDVAQLMAKGVHVEQVATDGNDGA